jgi:alpha-beta hydrolase superfamily lysophospholipase
MSRPSQNENKSSWIPEVLTTMAMASGIGYLAVSYSVSRWLTRPSHRPPQMTPSDLGFSWEKLECVTADRIRLTGWLVEPPEPRGTVALFHGLRHHKEKMLSRIALLASAGYRCVAFDHRAHGESGGKRTSFGYHEHRDVAAVLDLVRQRWPRQPRAALGVSMGAAAICFAAKQIPGLDAVILESCYVDIGSAFANRLKNGYPAWYQRLSRGVVWVSEKRLGMRLRDLVPALHIGDLAPAPVLLLTGTDDHHAPPAEAEELYDRCRGPREIWLVPGAGHRDVVETGGSLYRRRILDFLARRFSIDSACSARLAA